MKKWGGYILCFLFTLFLLFGCSCDKNEDDESTKVSLGLGDMNAVGFIELDDTEELITKIDNKDSFVLLVYASWCPHCMNFKPILNSVIQENNLIVYAIQSSKISGVESLEPIDGIPSLALYDKGEIVLITDPSIDYEFFSSTTGLKSFFDKYTYSPVGYYLTLEQLREKKKNKENFVVYFEDSSLESSSYFNENYMKDLYGTYHADKVFYVLNLNNYYRDEKQIIKDEFGLSENGSATFGYNDGVTPAFQFYNNGELTDMAIFANDEYSESEDSITITESYYSDNIHIGETIIKGEYYSTVDDFYNSKISLFLSQYLQFVD